MATAASIRIRSPPLLKVALKSWCALDDRLILNHAFFFLKSCAPTRAMPADDIIAALRKNIFLLVFLALQSLNFRSG